MLNDAKTLRKLEQIENRYRDIRFLKVAEIPMEIWETKSHYRQEPGAREGAKWRKAPPGTAWGGEGVTAWLRGRVRVPASCHGKKVLLRAGTGAPETLLFVDGAPRGVFDRFHTEVLLSPRAESGKRFRISLEAYAGHSMPSCSPWGSTPRRSTQGKKGLRVGSVDLVVEREEVSAFVWDLVVLRQLALRLDENSLRRASIIEGLAKVHAAVDALPEEREEASWRPKLTEARRILRALLRKRNGPTAPFMGLVGHSHLDTAWLWPIAETKRKAARTFSSVANLMGRYPELTFIQSSPCHAEWIRDEYPALFDEMRRLVKEGRWEPNGGMWVEPDCNIPSGESFIRQILLARQATEAWFGYRADTLWLPDVFGYSAALPQILRGCGIDFFCTTKMAWNDTTRFPYDTFLWRGIDGSAVVAHLSALTAWPDPATLIDQWNWVQHKDVQDRRLLAVGFGDGGGGPQADVVEIARRVGDLEGCPRAAFTTVSRFLRRVAAERSELPEWVGELYLECHRGTLTSMGQLKKGNRKAEYALRDAEILAVLAGLGGEPYPAGELRRLWKELLTNQFHDILPGTSIQAVNDQAVESFRRIRASADTLAKRALQSLAGNSGRASGMLLVNTLSWERTGDLVLENVPRGKAPHFDGVVTQEVEDADGRKKLIVSGLSIPALGGVAVPLRKRQTGGPSLFKVRKNSVETPHARVRFDRAGRIVSLRDKTSGREIVRGGGALNVLWIGEDVPLQWDNWDIDGDQRSKMRAEDRLVSREAVADGPLQLRLRSRYRLGERSTLVQDMVFHARTARIDFETVVDWREKHMLLKAGFELAVLADFARHEIQYGHVERATHRNLPQDRARFEVCAHKWTDLSENGFGVALLNDSKYGVSVSGSDVRLSLLKAGRHPDARGDEGRHSFTYSILPHPGGFSVESVVRPAYELNVPVRWAAGSGDTPKVAPLLELTPESVVVECVKGAESGQGFVVRLYEAGKTGFAARVSFQRPVRAVYEADMLEEKIRKLPVRDGTAAVYLRPFEVKTLLVFPKGG